MFIMTNKIKLDLENANCMRFSSTRNRLSTQSNLDLIVKNLTYVFLRIIYNILNARSVYY